MYKSEVTGAIYTADRKYFEKYIERVNNFWAKTNKSYKTQKAGLKSVEKY